MTDPASDVPRPAPLWDVVILTESRYESVAPTDAYLQNLLLEDRLLAEALARAGLRTTRVDWARPDFDWRTTRSAVFRSTWDYFERFAEFTAWLDRVAPHLTLFNSEPLIRWNADKHYLRDLHTRGVPVVPTTIVEAGSGVELAEAFTALGIDEGVVKPAVSGSARHTWRINCANVADTADRFAQLVAQEAMLLQPLVSSVLTEGEVSLVVIGGEVTHAVRKRARPGDFRVQDDHGGTVHPHAPSPAETELALRACAACRPAPLYARVDLVRDAHDRLVIMELELIEPELFFRFHPPAADRLAREIAARNL